MRFLLCFFIWIFFVGGLWTYTWQRDLKLPEKPSETLPAQTIRTDYILELTTTFSIEKDPFALDSDSEATPSIELRLNGQLLEFADEEFRRGIVQKINKIPDLPLGFNELFVSASPPISEVTLDHGIRIRVLDGDHIIVDETIWASYGARVSGTVGFTLTAKEEDGHDH